MLMVFCLFVFVFVPHYLTQSYFEAIFRGLRTASRAVSPSMAAVCSRATPTPSSTPPFRSGALAVTWTLSMSGDRPTRQRGRSWPAVWSE
jgi:hypothetical protein